MKSRGPTSRNRTQGGTVLVISLIFLLIMTLVGISAMQTTVLEEKMTGNLRDQYLAFHAGEGGLRDALDWLEEQAKSVSGFPLAKPNGSTKIWEECKVNNEENVCENGGTVAECGDGTTVACVAWFGDNDSGLIEFEGFLVLDNDVAQLPLTVVEERYAPPPELEEAAKRKGIVHYSQTTVGYGGSSQARSLSQSMVSFPRL